MVPQIPQPMERTMLRPNLAQFRYLLEPALATIGISLIGSCLVTVASMIFAAIAGQ
jgi:hypothetical protein